MRVREALVLVFRSALVLWFGRALVFSRALSLALSVTARLGLHGCVGGAANVGFMASSRAVVARSNIGVGLSRDQ